MTPFQKLIRHQPMNGLTIFGALLFSSLGLFFSWLWLHSLRYLSWEHNFILSMLAFTLMGCCLCVSWLCWCINGAAVRRIFTHNRQGLAALTGKAAFLLAASIAHFGFLYALISVDSASVGSWLLLGVGLVILVRGWKKAGAHLADLQTERYTP